MYTQLRAFNTTKGGSEPGMCLKNVRLGYSIPPKYDSAWEAWRATEQHKNRSIPKGVDVPVYFDYIYKGSRDGHIGVRLASGKFWSDGNTYRNLAAYEATHAPKYVGWGESVNDIRVINKSQEEDEMLTQTGANVLYRFLLGQEPSDYAVKHRIGKQTFDQAFQEIVSSETYINYVKSLKGAKQVPVKNLPEAIRTLFNS